MGSTSEVEKQLQYVYYRQYGQSIYFRYKEYRDTVTHSDVITDYEPTLYTPTPMKTGLTSIYGENVAPTTYPTIKAAREAAEKYRGMGAKVYGNPKAANQFVIDLYEGKPVDFNTDIIRIGFIDIEVDISRDSGFPFPEQAKRPINAITMFDTVDKKFYIWGLTRLDGQVFDPDNLQTEQARETAKRFPIEYRHYTDEVALIKNFLEHLRDQPLDYISGWNSETFDLPYIWYRCVKKVGQEFTESCLSPFGIVKTREKEGKYGKTYTDVEIFGTTHLDYLNVYRKFVLKPRASYKLDDIAEVELDKQKISYDGTLFDLYENDYQRFIEYNFIDVGLMVDIDAKLKLFNIAFAVIYKTYCRPSDVLGTTGVWESNIAGYLYAKNTVPLYFQLPSAKRPYEGAYVKEPIPGKYQYMISIDLNSLYPHLIKECKIGPETLVPRDRVPANMQHFMDYEVDDYVNQLVDTSALKGTNYSLSPSGQLYDKSKECFLYDMMTETYGDRKIVKSRGIKVHRTRKINLGDEINHRGLDLKTKSKTDDTSFYYNDDIANLTDDQLLAAYRFHDEEETKCDLLQHALKILLNSAYGALGNQYFMYFDVDNAESITLYGQLVNKYTNKRINEFMNELMETDGIDYAKYGDTDSLYLDLTPVKEMMLGDETDIQVICDALDEFFKTVLSPAIVAATDDLAEYMNAYENAMVWERETISDGMISVSKKCYAMRVWDDEGSRYHDAPKLKIVGLESVKSSTPKWSQKYLKECYAIALEKDEKAVQKHISKVYKAIKNLSPEEIAQVSSVNNIEKYWSHEKGFQPKTPAGVRAAGNYNTMLKKTGMEYLGEITSGMKIKYVPLKMPNPLNDKSIGFESKLPPEFGLHDYIDTELLFEKAFKKPMQRFLTAVGWSVERRVNVFDFLS